MSEGEGGLSWRVVSCEGLLMFGSFPQADLMFWRSQGVDGVQLSGVERVASVVPSLWADIRAIVQNNGTDVEKKRYVIY